MSVAHLIIKFPTFYGTRTFSTMFTKAAIGTCPPEADGSSTHPHTTQAYSIRVYFDIFLSSTPRHLKWFLRPQFVCFSHVYCMVFI
jgi:hypothetical protein